MNNTKSQIKMLKSQLVSLEQLLEVQENSVIEQSERLKNAQEALIHKERLSVVGEMSAKIAHEILNPMTSILARIELRLNKIEKNHEINNSLFEIIEEWNEELKNDNLINYLSEKVTDIETGKNITYGYDDIQMLKAIEGHIRKNSETEHDDILFIYKNLNRIVKTIDGVRSMARRTGHIEKININTPIKEAIDILHYGIEKKGINIFLNLTEELPLIKADFNELIQVFSNVIKNASQAILKEKDLKKISITTESNNNKVEIRISDTGTGIHAEEVKLIFNPSFSKKTREEGTGLGLDICQNLIRKYNGEINVEKSEIGKGSTFLIYFPY